MVNEPRALPHDKLSERCLVGSLLINPDCMNDVMGIVETEDFYTTSYATIFQTMVELYEINQSFDLNTVSSELINRKEFGKAGGSKEITGAYDSVPTSLNAVLYANNIREKSIARKMILLFSKSTKKFWDDTVDIKSSIEEIENEVIMITGERSGKINKSGEVVTDILEELDTLVNSDKKLTGIGTGFRKFDKLTHGLQDGDLIYIAARPSMGKSTFIQNCIETIGLSGIPLGLISIEMSDKSFVKKMISSVGMVDHDQIRGGYVGPEEWRKVIKASEAIAKAPIYIECIGGNISRIRTIARKMKRAYGIRVLFVDYLQLIPGRGNQKEYEYVTSNSQDLKRLAKELNIPVVVCCQLSRDIEKRKDQEPKLSDLRGSGAIEQDGDVIGFLHRDSTDITLSGTDPTTDFLLLKQRNGPIGRFTMFFDKMYCKFTDLDHSSSTKPIKAVDETEYYSDDPPF